MIAQDNIRAMFALSKVAKGSADYARPRSHDVDEKVSSSSVSLTDLHAPDAAFTAGAVAAVVGVLGGGELVVRGLTQLEVPAPRHVRAAGAVTGLIAGAAAVLAARHAGSWWLLPVALVWAYGLAAAATCDAITQRVPTPLVRQSAGLTAVLVLVAAAGTGHWRWAQAAALAAVATGCVFGFCWRFLGAGFGDVRIAVLGGVGLANPTHTGLTAGLAAFIVITLGQAVTTLARGGNRHTLFPYGPAIALAFLVAAIL
jgi:leader peptidase (prepilin peptidase) / N-methyltransferase